MITKYQHYIHIVMKIIVSVDDVKDENELIQKDRFESQNKNNNALRSEDLKFQRGNLFIYRTHCWNWLK